MQKANCVQLTPDQAECSGVIVKFACVKVHTR